MSLNPLIEPFLHRALDGNAILFAGAGFSAGATNVLGAPVPTGVELSNQFCVALGLHEDRLPLDATSDLYLSKFGEDATITFLRERFTISKPTPDHIALSRIPWKRIYTTNYDNLLERTSAEVGRALPPYVIADSPDGVDKSKSICLHINGFVERLNRGSLRSDLKLTDSSYANADQFEGSTWSELFRSDLRLAEAVFFIGYSLYDIDIKRILVRIPELKDRTVFILNTATSSVVQFRVAQYGAIETIGLSGLAENFTNLAKTYKPKEKGTHRSFTSFLPYEKPTDSADTVRDIDVFNLFLHGEVNKALLWATGQAQHSPNAAHYYVFRERIATMLADIVANKCKDFVVYSDLGNGKTLFIDGLLRDALAKNFSVFKFYEKNTFTEHEIDAICSTNDPTIVVIENALSNFDVVKQLYLKKRANLALVMTARTSAFEVGLDRIVTLVAEDNIRAVNLNHLTNVEVEAVIRLLDTYGLWGDLASASHDGKRRYIEDECAREFQAVLLGVFRSPTIRQRIDAIFSFLSEKQAFKDFAVVILILEYLGFSVEPFLLASLVDKAHFNEVGFRREPAIRELFDFNGGAIRTKSSVLAKFLLTGLSDGNIVVDILIKIVEKSELHSRENDTYYQIYRALTRFAAIQELLPEKNRRAACVRFFESIKNLKTCRENPHFWLQYAIARLSFDEFDPARTYFDNAYALAKDIPGYDTFQIDNHFARFKLRKAIADAGNAETSMQLFVEAHQILSRQANRLDNRYYPYRVASLYRDFIEAFHLRMTEHDISFVVRCCTYIQKCSQRFRKDLYANLQVERCRRDMEFVIRKYGKASEPS